MDDLRTLGHAAATTVRRSYSATERPATAWAGHAAGVSRSGSRASKGALLRISGTPLLRCRSRVLASAYRPAGGVFSCLRPAPRRLRSEQSLGPRRVGGPRGGCHICYGRYSSAGVTACAAPGGLICVGPRVACGLAGARFWPMSVHFRLGYAGDREMAMSRVSALGG
jgi:hypothetical protein